MKRIPAMMILATAGCQWGGNLDRAQFQAHQTYYRANEALLGASANFLDVAGDYARKKHEILHQFNTMAWEGKLKELTDKDGKVLASDMIKAMESLDKRRAIERSSIAKWDKASSAWTITLKRFRDLNTTMKAKDPQWQEAKESAAAAFNAAIQTIATTAAGIGIGGAL